MKVEGGSTSRPRPGWWRVMKVPVSTARSLGDRNRRFSRRNRGQSRAIEGNRGQSRAPSLVTSGLALASGRRRRGGWTEDGVLGRGQGSRGGLPARDARRDTLVCLARVRYGQVGPVSCTVRHCSSTGCGWTEGRYTRDHRNPWPFPVTTTRITDDQTDEADNGRPEDGGGP
jgi:hypothetical protein